MKLSFTPCSFSIFSFIRSRSALTADMSISLNVVSVAVELCESSRFSAMRLRRVDLVSRGARSPVGGRVRCGAGTDGAGTDGAGTDGAGADGAGADGAGAAGAGD